MEDEDFEVNSNQLSRRLKHLNGVINHFWSRWRSEYLSELREHHQYAAGRPSQLAHIAVGEVVIIKDDKIPRSFWKLGRIQEVIRGKDGVARGALLKVAARGDQSTQLRRPVQLLYPLEIKAKDTYQDASAIVRVGSKYI